MPLWDRGSLTRGIGAALVAGYNLVTVKCLDAQTRPPNKPPETRPGIRRYKSNVNWYVKRAEMVSKCVTVSKNFMAVKGGGEEGRERRARRYARSEIKPSRSNCNLKINKIVAY